MKPALKWQPDKDAPLFFTTQGAADLIFNVWPLEDQKHYWGIKVSIGGFFIKDTGGCDEGFAKATCEAINDSVLKAIAAGCKPVLIGENHS